MRRIGCVIFSCLLLIRLGYAQTPAELNSFRAAHAIVLKKDRAAKAEIKRILEILLAVAKRATPQKNGNAISLETQLNGLQKIVKRSDALPSQFAHVGAFVARSESEVAYTVKYGPISMLAIFSNGKRLPTPAPLEYISSFQGSPYFVNDDTLVLSLGAVQDAGMRTQFKLFALGKVGGKYVIGNSIQRECTLEYGGIKLDYDTLAVLSLTAPKSFFTASFETLFPLEEDFVIMSGKLKVMRTSYGMPQFRFLDDWMSKAMSTKTPDALQKKFRALYPQKEMINDYSVDPISSTRTKYSLGFTNRIQFVIETSSKSGKMVYKVASVSKA